jgi:hypothetical protein
MSQIQQNEDAQREDEIQYGSVGMSKEEMEDK